MKASEIMLNLVFLVSLAGSSFQKSLLQLGTEVTGSDYNPCKGDDVLSCVLALVDVSAFDDEILILPGGVELTKQNDIQESMSRSGRRGLAKSMAYSGQGCEAVFTLRRGRVMGNVEYKDGSDFVLEPCKNFEGCHVWKEEDTAHMVEEEGEEVPIEMRADELISREAKEELIKKGKDDDTTIVEYSIKYYYTQEFAEATDDIELYFDQVIAETNQGYINSKIPVRVWIFCIEATTLKDEKESSTQLSKFTSYKGSAEALRGSADAAALLLIKTSSCGRGYLDSWDNGKTVTVQAKGCALGYYTMGHELAHNFGGTHDREHSSPNSYYSFGHGGYIEPRYRTIMGYPKSGYSRVNYYSSPDVFFQGVVTGSDSEDNARVIKENRFGFAAVGDESGTCEEATATSTPPVTSLGECKSINRLFIGGDTLAKTKVKNAKVCEDKCWDNMDCTHWTFFDKKFKQKKLRKRCVLMSGDISKVEKTKKAVSGAIDKCA